MSEHDDVICQVRESFSGLCMDKPVEEVMARSRARRRRRVSGLTAAGAVVAGTAAAITLNLGGVAPAHSGTPRPATASPPARLAAFSVTSGPGDNTTLILRKGPQYQRMDPGALRRALARQGIPALVTVGTFCRSRQDAPASNEVVRASNLPDGSATAINGRAIPPGTRLSIGLFPGYTRMLLVKNGAPLMCSSASQQPAAHITPAGTSIRGRQ